MNENNVVAMTPAGGWVKFHRVVIEKGWLTNHKLWVFWSYCLLKASHKYTDVLVGSHQVPLAPGEFVFGRKRAATDLNMSEKSVRTCIDTLLRLNSLRAVIKASTHSIYSVVNWELYQGQDVDEGQQIGRAEGPEKGRAGAGEGPRYKNREEGKNKIVSSDAPAFRLSAFLSNLIKSRNLEFKEPDLQAWARHVDLMLRLDKRTEENIAAVIEWSQSNLFWQTNILSTEKLRKHFDRLYMEMSKGAGRGASQ